MASNQRVPADKSKLFVADRIEPLILTIRGHKILLDSDLAALYGVSTKRLNEQVPRNRLRFPEDFRFQLIEDQAAASRSQNATLKQGRGEHRKYLPYGVTERGAIMAATILNRAKATSTRPWTILDMAERLAGRQYSVKP